MCEHQALLGSLFRGWAGTVHGQGGDGGAHGEKCLQALGCGMVGEEVRAWRAHGKEAGLGAVNIPMSMIKVFANVSAGVVNSGAP